jgi:hypothetical protein
VATVKRRVTDGETLLAARMAMRPSGPPGAGR